MTHYSFDEDGVCCASKPGYAVARPLGMEDKQWEHHAGMICKSLNDEGKAFDGFEGQGRRLYQLCVERGAAPGQVLHWLRAKLEEKAAPIFHGPMILEYPGEVFVLFDGTDDGSTILGAYRTLEYTRQREAFYARMENEGPGPDDPMGFENAAALQAVLKDIWWKGFNNGRGQTYAGHNAGYEHVDCATDVDGYITGRLGRKA